MNKKNRLFVLLPILCMFILSSCDPKIEYEYSIINNSNKELRVYTNMEYLDSSRNISHIDSSVFVIILPNSENQFYESSGFGTSPHDEGDDFLNILDTLIIDPTDSSTLQLNYLNRENWSYTNDIVRMFFVKGGTNSYKLEVSNDDFK